jgi:hypothetical protein
LDLPGANWRLILSSESFGEIAQLTALWLNVGKYPSNLPVWVPESIEIRLKLVFSLGCFFEEFHTLEEWKNAQ